MRLMVMVDFSWIARTSCDGLEPTGAGLVPVLGGETWSEKEVTLEYW